MNYKRIYETLIEKGRLENTNEEAYYEKHHIVPKSLGGSDSESNLVNLTFRQHYLAHELLVKIYPENKKLIHALWMMTITTQTSLLKSQVDTRIEKRVRSIKNDQKLLKYVTSHAYEKCKKIFRDMMNGHEVTEKTKKLISQRTREAMNSPEVIKKTREGCAKGSKGTRWYYDKLTLKCFKWFKGDPEIDLEKFCYGRPPMSESQKKKLSDVQTKLNRITLHNSSFKLTYWLYEDYFKKPDGWGEGKVEYKNNHKFMRIINDVKIELVNEDFFEFEKLFFKMPILSGRKKNLNPGFFDLCAPVLQSWSENKNFKQDLKDFLKSHESEIEAYSKKYLKQ